MNEQLAASKEGRDEAEVAGEYGSKPLYRTLGYFSIIGLLRVHCLLGDFTLALKMMDNIELNKKVTTWQVPTNCRQCLSASRHATTKLTTTSVSPT
jgi:translation initiation factor 3 subunit L